MSLAIVYRRETGMISICGSKGEQEKEVFTLGFEHGRSQNAAYAYIILIIQWKKWAYRTDDLEILTNTDSVQVVRHKKLGIWADGNTGKRPLSISR